MNRFMNFGINTEVATNDARIRDAFVRSIPKNLAPVAINKKMNPTYTVTYRK